MPKITTYSKGRHILHRTCDLEWKDDTGSNLVVIRFPVPLPLCVVAEASFDPKSFYAASPGTLKLLTEKEAREWREARASGEL